MMYIHFKVKQMKLFIDYCISLLQKRSFHKVVTDLLKTRHNFLKEETMFPPPLIIIIIQMLLL